ncbi:MAG: glycolate oxidase subunit GlcE [Proteobacteria bacterium]|nr:glycolate oxidase subunit GlcE [Pseudomonadota bacterium]
MTLLSQWSERIAAAAVSGTRLCIRGGGTKDFYGNEPRGETFETRDWQGIESYEPSELVITARAGTPLAQIEAELAAKGQMLAFEPPHFGVGATLGGCIAAGLAGPRRASAGYAWGGVRDAVLGARLLDGRGRLLKFGGTVIKNVAGYDVSRLLAGSLGTLGVIAELSIKVLPRPASELTLRFEMTEGEALRHLNSWAGQPLPLSASCWHEGALRVRLAGAQPAVEASARVLGGEREPATLAEDSWHGVREQQHPFFEGARPLWRFSIPTNAAPLALPGAQLIEWGGALRWLRSDASADALRARARELGGHATLFRGALPRPQAFTPLSPALLAIHQRLKREFDPAGIFNPGRMYPEF